MTQDSDSKPAIDPLGALFATLLLRLWLGIRSLQAGIEKFAGKEPGEIPVLVDGKATGLVKATQVKVYGAEHYSGVPGPLMDSFLAEPFIPNFMLGFYNLVLGPLLIVMGLFLLAGLFTRWTLLAMGLVYTSLTFGLILINQPSGIAWLAVHMVLIAMMLLLAGHNRFEAGGLLCKRKA